MIFDATANPNTLLIVCGATVAVLLAMASAFVAGVVSAPWLQEFAVRRAAAQIHRMYQLVIKDVERAQRMCAELASASGGTLTAAEWQRLERLQQQFQETFARIAQAAGIAVDAAEQVAPSAKAKDFAIEWVRTPVDPASDLPDKQAFEQNLATMLARGAETDLESGLLLIRMDKADALRRRLGAEAVEMLLARIASLVIRGSRDRDLLCRLSGDTLGLLCPSLPPLAGCKTAEKIRETIRNYPFHLQDDGPEVLVTASFGYANCGPADTADLVRDRAGDSLARSQSLGRNQLHVHDGETYAVCRT